MNVRRTAIFINTLIAFLVSACGGGSSGSSSENGTITPYTPSATVLAAKQANYATPFYGSVGSGTGCANVTNTTAYVLPNTITYAGAGVSELSQQQAAEYSEKAVTEIRGVFGIGSTVGFSGTKVQICVQQQSVAGGADGVGEKDGFVAKSTDSTVIERGYLVNDFDLYKRLVKHELVHTFQNNTLGTNGGGIVETWFSEGLAEFVASGKSAKSKTEILNLVNAQNPIAVQSYMGTAQFTYYPAFQSSIAYLFDANGAKNNLTMMPAFFAAVKTANLNPCVPGLGPICPATPFVQIFESRFKEANGAAILLRTGTNNFQSSIATRLANFL
jgi:hypothetical protein